MINESSEDMSRLNKNFKKKSGYSFDIIDMSNRKALNYIKKEWINKGKGIKGAIAVCKEDDRLAGYIYVKEKPIGNIGPFMVYKEYRGYGVSELLLKKAINDYKGKRLGVYADNEIALRLYKKFGFVIVNESEDDEGNKYYIMELKSSIVRENCMEILDESYFDEDFLSDLYNKPSAKGVEDYL